MEEYFLGPTGLLAAVENAGLMLFLDISFMQKFEEEEDGSAEFEYPPEVSSTFKSCQGEKFDINIEDSNPYHGR